MEIDYARAYLLRAEKGAQVFAHVVAGLNAGLFEGIARHGEPGVLPGTLAREMGYFEDYVRVWCETAFAWQILDHTGDGRFRVAEGFEPLLMPSVQGSLAGVLRIRGIMVRERFEHPEFMRTGAVRTYLDHGEQLSRAVADSAGSGANLHIEHVYKRIAPIKAKLDSGARVLEVGCGTGRLLPMLAQEFPGATFLGIDPDGHAIEMGRSELAATGLQHRIHLERRGAEDLHFQEEFDLVSMCNVMHEIRADIRLQGVRGFWQALRPGGILISTDQYYPSQLEDFRRDEYYVAVMDQAAEVVWGNRHLSQESLAELFASSGFQRSEFHVVPLPGQQSPRLVALAFK